MDFLFLGTRIGYHGNRLLSVVGICSPVQNASSVLSTNTLVPFNFVANDVQYEPIWIRFKTCVKFNLTIDSSSTDGYGWVVQRQ